MFRRKRRHGWEKSDLMVQIIRVCGTGLVRGAPTAFCTCSVLRRRPSLHCPRYSSTMSAASPTTTFPTSLTSRLSAWPTPTRTSFTITSFPYVPLTTTFTASDPSCSDIQAAYFGGFLLIDPLPESCLPSGFSTQPTAFFSPGIVCPSGYWTACVNNLVVKSITIVTCCPTRGTSIHLSCVNELD